MKPNSLNVDKSRYSTGGKTDSFSTRLGWWERYVYTKNRDDVTYTIEQKYNVRPDLLAYEVYGSPSYMWLILQYNNILDVNVEFVVGKKILLPTPQRVKVELT